MTKFYRENADLTHEILGPHGEQTLHNVSDAVEMMMRTARGGYPGGSPTFSLLSGDRFIDGILEKLIAKESTTSAGAAGGSAGAALGAPLGVVGMAVGGVGGIAVGIGAQSLFANAKAQVMSLLREALLDPKKARALMMNAKPASLTAVPRAMRTQLEPFLSRRTAAAGSAGALTQKEQKPAKPGELRPGQVISAVVDGMTVKWRYKGGDPKEQTSWDRSPATQQ
jgi:hypothetical protein